MRPRNRVFVVTFLILYLMVVGLHAQHPSKPSAAPRERAARTAAPPKAAAPNYDGWWAGTTSQNKGIAFRIREGQLRYIRIEYGMPGAPCFRVADFVNFMDLDADGPPIKAPSDGQEKQRTQFEDAGLASEILKGSISVKTTMSAGYMHGVPFIDLTGRFTKPSSVAGRVMVVAINPDVRQADGKACRNEINLDWVANRTQEPKFGADYRVDQVAETTQLELAAPADAGVQVARVTANPGERFVVVRLQFPASVTSIDLTSLALTTATKETYPAAGYGDNQRVYNPQDLYCMLEKGKQQNLERSDDGKTFWGSCSIRATRRVFMTFLHVERPAIVFAVPQSIPLSALQLRYRDSVTPLQ